MSSGNRYENLTLVIAAVAALLGILAVGYGLVLETYSEQRELHAEYQERATEYQREAQQRIADACVGISGPAFSECISNEVAAYEANKPADEDLRAQQDMALWALWMFIAAGATVLVTIVGIYYVRETLDATRATVTETSRIGEAQVRAYLSVKSVEFDWEDVGDGTKKMTCITAKWENTGQSPARHVEVSVQGRKTPVDCEKPIEALSSILENLELSTASVAAGSHVSAERDVEDDFSSDWIAGKIGLVVHAAATFVDVFGRRHWVEECSTARAVIVDGKANLRFNLYPHHNREYDD